MYVDSIKIGNANARAIRTVVDLEAVPTQVFENSPMLIKVGETLYVKNKVAGNIIGTWHLKDTISYATNVGVNFDFVSNDTTYTALLWQNSELHYASQATGEVVVYNSSGWVNQAYRTIVIKSGENADLLAFLQASAEKLIDGYYYYSAVSGSGVAFIDITGLDVLPSEYQNEETLKTAILFDTDHLLRLTWIDDMYYFGNTDDFQYRYLSIDTSDWVIMRYDLQEIAKAPKVVNLNTYVPSTATNGTLDSSVLATLQASDSNYIVFNNEIFKLADKQHNEGYLVYSHNGHDTTGCFFQKCITITISTLGWVLETQENQAKLVSGTNIKTINGESVLGSGNITIEGGGSGGGLNVLDITHEIDPSLIDENVEVMDILMETFSKLGSFTSLSDGPELSEPIIVQFYNLGANYFSLTDEQLNNINNGIYDAINVKIQATGGGTTFVFFDLMFNKQVNCFSLINDERASCYSFTISGYYTNKKILVLSGGFCKSGIYLSLIPVLYKPVSVQVNDDDTIDLTIN